jgi:hypothetical protein
MPPHCDSLDGPVVRAARRALEVANVDLVLPFVPETAEVEVRDVFAKVMLALGAAPASRDVAERYFFETVVRLHRAGEGAPFTGLKPAGLDVGPVVPVAEKAIEAGTAASLEDVLVGALRAELAHRFAELRRLAPGASGTVEETRAWVRASLGLQVWANALYHAMHATAHEAAHEHAH